MSQLDPTPLPPTSFWQNPRVQTILPLATSLAFHAVLIVYGLLILKTVDVIRSVAIEQIIIPDTNLVENADTGGVKNPGINSDPTRAAEQDVEQSKDSPDWANKKSDTLNANLLSGSADVQQNITPIGAGSNVGGALSGLTNKGVGDASGNLAPFGPAAGGGEGQGKGMFGMPGGNVKKVIYVSDSSGSLLGERQLLLNDELKKAIDRLRPSQSFNIFFFKLHSYEAIDKKTLLLATQANKARAFKFITDNELRATSDPVPALEDALDLQPDLIFLLTDGMLDNPDKVQEVINKRNSSRKVHINTILFTSDMVRDEESKALRDIAVANGGTFKLVRAADLLR